MRRAAPSEPLPAPPLPQPTNGRRYSPNPQRGPTSSTFSLLRLLPTRSPHRRRTSDSVDAMASRPQGISIIGRELSPPGGFPPSPTMSTPDSDDTYADGEPKPWGERSGFSFRRRREQDRDHRQPDDRGSTFLSDAEDGGGVGVVHDVIHDPQATPPSSNRAVHQMVILQDDGVYEEVRAPAEEVSQERREGGGHHHKRKKKRRKRERRHPDVVPAGRLVSQPPPNAIIISSSDEDHFHECQHCDYVSPKDEKLKKHMLKRHQFRESELI